MANPVEAHVPDRAGQDPLDSAAAEDLWGEVPATEHELTLDPTDWNPIRALGHRMIDDMVDLLRTVRRRPTWQPVPAAIRSGFRAPLPQQPASPHAVYEDFRALVQPYPTGNIHPRFWGWVMGTGSITGAFGELLGATLDGNAIGGDQGSTYIEAQVLAWLQEMIRYPPDASGILVDGGSVANLVGITAAREAKAGIDADGHGLSGLSAHPRLYCSSETHNSVAKAAALLGMGTQGVRSIPVHADYTVDVRALRAAIRDDRAQGHRPFCIVGNAGTVNTGAFDDLDALADVAADEGLWLHVDGAFGAFAALGGAVRHLVHGMERADSLAVDLHKWLHMPYDVGCAFVRHPATHRASFARTASYLDPQTRGFAAGSQWFAEYGPQLSRGNRALKVWMELKTHGVARYARLVDQNVRQAAYLARLIERDPAFELVAPVPLNVVCFRMTSPGADAATLDQLNRELLYRIQESGVALPSSTVLHEGFVLRVAITNHRTRERDLDIFMTALVSTAATLRREHAATADQAPPAHVGTGDSHLRIVDYRPEHHETFQRLNLDWICRYFAVEPRDERDLSDPDAHVLAHGGVILIAEWDGAPVGTCALLRDAGGRYELAKMAVAEAARGRGIGRALAEGVIDRARALGASELELFTNSVLEPAVALYRALGFVEAPLDHADSGANYRRANMRMVRHIASPDRPA